MNNNLELLLKQIQGTWISQKTTYCLINKKLTVCTSENTMYLKKKLENLKTFNYCYHFKNISLNKKNIMSYIFTLSNQCIDLQIINKSSNYKAYIDLHSNQHIIKTCTYKGINYYEYNYMLNSKLLLSIAILKKKDKYIAIIFSSHIKK